MPTVLGLSLMVLNPIAPLNWITALILYFSMVRKKKSDKLRYLKALGLYLLVLIPIYFLMCLFVQALPPETPMTFLFKLLIGSLCNAGS